jgi:hypothetical protein
METLNNLVKPPHGRKGSHAIPLSNFKASSLRIGNTFEVGGLMQQ